uniref:HTH CENPB-type domain-containing protein n=1 Tax=Paramormyrops kingsleyae TaxID=1676925 RepID=A0A3B3RVV8_9TELE
MPQSYKRKTGRAPTPLDDMDRAVKEVEKGKSICQKKKIDEKEIRPGYKRTGLVNQVFDEHMEKELAEHIKTLAAMFHGLSPMKCRRDWFAAFKARHHLSCRIPEATSLGRATAFNRHNVGEFFDSLSKVMDMYMNHMVLTCQPQNDTPVHNQGL